MSTYHEQIIHELADYFQQHIVWQQYCKNHPCGMNYMQPYLVELTLHSLQDVYCYIKHKFQDGAYVLNLIIKDSSDK